MRFLNFFKNNKTIKGIGLLLLGVGANAIPGGQAISPYLFAAGSAYLAPGIGHKIIKAAKGNDPFAGEKEIVNKIKGE